MRNVIVSDIAVEPLSFINIQGRKSYLRKCRLYKCANSTKSVLQWNSGTGSAQIDVGPLPTPTALSSLPTMDCSMKKEYSCRFFYMHII